MLQLLPGRHGAISNQDTYDVAKTSQHCNRRMLSWTVAVTDGLLEMNQRSCRESNPEARRDRSKEEGRTAARYKNSVRLVLGVADLSLAAQYKVGYLVIIR